MARHFMIFSVFVGSNYILTTLPQCLDTESKIFSIEILAAIRVSACFLGTNGRKTSPRRIMVNVNTYPRSSFSERGTLPCLVAWVDRCMHKRGRDRHWREGSSHLIAGQKYRKVPVQKKTSRQALAHTVPTWARGTLNGMLLLLLLLSLIKPAGRIINCIASPAHCPFTFPAPEPLNSEHVDPWRMAPVRCTPG
ncbi:hypothetical protein EV426DRAFT_413468 [Tirmania nivea]|nr:hypothetical protein EV426DRAFT_413468 [Tirmania nivea]